MLCERILVRAMWVVELVRNLVAHGYAREGKWRGNWRMEWVASTLTPPPNVVYPALLKLIRTPWLPAVDWTDAPNDLNGLVCFGERRNLVSARVHHVPHELYLNTHTHGHIVTAFGNTTTCVSPYTRGPQIATVRKKKRTDDILTHILKRILKYTSQITMGRGSSVGIAIR